MSAPDGYRVTLECGHADTWDHDASSLINPRIKVGCPTCGEFQPVLDVTPAYATERPPALRSRWVRVLSRVPGLSRLVDAIYGPWTGGDE